MVDMKTVDEATLGVDNESFAAAMRKMEEDNMTMIIMGMTPEVIQEGILGLEKRTAKQGQNEVVLTGLFSRYFSKSLDADFIADDLAVFAKEIPDFKDLPKQVKIIKGCHNKRSYVVIRESGSKRLLLGAANSRRSVWFYFENSNTQIPNGRIFKRHGLQAVLKPINTFEINPFVKSEVIVTDPETGIAETKTRTTLNTSWIFHVIDNMEKYVFNGSI